MLVVEDDAEVADSLVELLEREGYSTEHVGDGAAVAPAIAANRPDLVLLDLGLPSVDGLDLLEALAATAPVIVLTGRGAEGDRVLGLDLGADDYITKPYSPRELAARVRSVLRRGAEAPGRTIVHGELEVDLEAREVRVGAGRIELTNREFELLAFLAARPRCAVSRLQLLRDVWSSDHEWQDQATVTEHVRRLRSKLGEIGCWIRTVRSVGYRFEPPPASALLAASSTSTDAVGSDSSTEAWAV